MTGIVCLDDDGDAQTSVSTTLRNRVRAEFLARQKDRPVLDVAENECARALDPLYRMGALSLVQPDDGGPATLMYAPSSDAVSQVADERCAWAQYFSGRVRKSIRSTPGALFRFPAETGDGAISVFITDWSPCPAACAIAVHRLHPCLASHPDLPKAGSFFTGRYVRHALTGDLLPVWVADWVKADFGTGAVLVNPAHNQTDLEFGRAVGLPIRFALLPEGASDHPDAWPTPPVIKTGSVVRSGRYDGLSITEAQTTYFDELESRGLAERHEDRRLPAVPVCALTPDENGAWRLSLADGVVAPAGDGADEARRGPRFSLAPHAVFRAAAAVRAHDAGAVLAAATAHKSLGPAFAALLLDLGADLAKVTLSLTGAAECPVQRNADQSMRLACLVAGKPDQPIVINKQLLEQADSFIANAEKIAGQAPNGGAPPPAGIGKALARQDLLEAFRTMHKWQKDLLKSGQSVDQTEYGKLVDVFLGTDGAA